jgi:hypothetical protein
MTSTQKENRKLWIIFLIALLIALLPWVLLAHDVKKENLNLSKAGKDAIGYAQAVRVGNTIYVSGSVGGGTWPAEETRSSNKASIRTQRILRTWSKKMFSQRTLTLLNRTLS